MISALITRLSEFSKVFEMAREALEISIGKVLAQEGYPVAYFSEKLNESKL